MGENVALPGCTIIYAPEGQAGEYAALACNLYDGCGHRCRYCYVPLVRHITREKFDEGAVPRKDFLQRLLKDARKYQAAGITEQVMLSFTTDPYHPGDTALTRQVLEVLQAHGLGICTLTKGGARALRDLDLFRPDRDAFAVTLTEAEDGAVWRKWEPGAAPPSERIAALQRFHDAGVFTWVSLEPTLSTEASLAVVEATAPWVDLYKVGKANYLGEFGKAIDWRRYTQEIRLLLESLNKRAYFKRDLQPYLPPGYHNPLRVPQSHARPEARHGA